MRDALESIFSAVLDQRDLVGKGIQVSKYELLASEIPDEVVIIDEVYPADELVAIYQRFEPYVAEDSVLPFLGTWGGNAVCFGFAEANFGCIFYYDFDFGLFKLDETLECFLTSLMPRKR